MSDFDINNKVVQANNLIQQSQWALGMVPLKIFKVLVACIDTKTPPKDNTVTIKKGELFNMVGSESVGGYDYLKRKIRELQKTSIPLKEDKREIYVPLVNKIIWNTDNDEITCRFDEDLMPYLIDMHMLFLQYPVGSLKNFKSKYGLILYEYLLSRERQERQPEHIYSIKADEFRRLTGTENKFKDNKDLKNKVIKKAVEDINDAGVEFLVMFTTDGGRGRGGKLTSIKFTIRKRTSYKETDFDVVERPEWIRQLI